MSKARVNGRRNQRDKKVPAAAVAVVVQHKKRNPLLKVLRSM
jgi:hypothetical protein